MDEKSRINLEDTNLIDLAKALKAEEENAEEAAEPAAEGERELKLFEDAAQKEQERAERDDRHRRARSLLTALICGLCGLLLGIGLTLLLVSIECGGLNNLRSIKLMGKYDSSIFSELLYRIDTLHFGETPSSKELTEAAAHAMVDAVGDRYAAYFSKQEYSDYLSSLNGNIKGGVGISVYAPDENGALIHRVYEGTFADEAGLKSGDVIVALDGVSVGGRTLDELVDMIGGDSGTTVKFTVKRGEETLDMDVMRGNVYIKRVEYKMLDNDIGYIYISSFTGYAETELRSAISDLETQGAKSLIIDLRDDPGGSLSMVVNMSDMMLPVCTIASMQGNTTDPTEYFYSDGEMCELPFVVLVNGNSASASEIFAGAMQDNGRAKIIGTQTYGKGIVQTTFTLNDDHGYLKLTTDAYFTPSGRSLSGTGITPDLVVELPDEVNGMDIYTLVNEYDEQDAQLQAAISELTGGN